MRTLPFVAQEPSLALKGGTAINLFFRDLPRLSVDIDLTYLPIEDRGASLAGIDVAMKRIAERIRQGIAGAQVSASQLRPEGSVTKLVVRAAGVQIKVEVTPVLRGCVFDATRKSVSASVEDDFGFAESLVVSFEDLFAGKMVAALDRQHPRDLFDVAGLLSGEGLSDRLRAAFVVYVISHNRPAVELLSPNYRNIEVEFRDRFAGMTATAVSLEDLLGAREQLLRQAVGGMPDAHRRFLVSVERGKPDWGLLALDHIRRLPAVRWKLENLAKLTAGQREQHARELGSVLSVGSEH